MAIDPILTSNKNGSTLDDKKVNFTSGNSFGNDNFQSSTTVNSDKKVQAKKNAKRKRTHPQRMADTTVLKCRTLQPFMAELERADKASIDDVVNALADFYINNGLPDRQQDVFQGMYDMNVKRL